MFRRHQAFRSPKRVSLVLATLGLSPLWVACVATQGRMGASAAESSAAGKKRLTPAAILGHRPSRVDFSGSYARDLQWLPAGQRFLHRRDGVLHVVDAVSGDARPAYDYEAFQAVLKQHEDFEAGAARRLSRNPTIFNDDRSRVVLEHRDRLYVYRFDDQVLTRLTDEPEQRRLVTLSPDAQHVAFVKENNLHAINCDTGRESQLTHDGSDTVLNGVLDWVYQEEVFGRGQWRSYWWSEDAGLVAYLQLDESEVPVHTAVDHLSTHPVLSQMRYPKAGDPNPKVRLGVVPAEGGETVWVDLTRYDDEIIVVGVAWSPDGRLAYCVQDREARWLDLNQANPETGASTTLLRETTPAWTTHFGMPHWLDDGSFLWRSARDGWPHLYHYTRYGDLIRPVTDGRGEVRRLHGVDPERGWVYFSGTRDSHVESHVYRVPLAGGPIERLTEPGFSHGANFDPQFRYFIDTFSNVTTPTKVYLRTAAGELVRVISENEVPALAEYRLSPPQFVRLPTGDGHDLSAMIIRPLGTNPQHKHPVMVFTYAGPHGPVVHNSWNGRDYMFKQLLAQEGHLVWTIDPYSASGEGEVSAWHAYKRLGVTEVADLEESLHWLSEHENVDLTRVGITGHSYGGFMVAFALTHSKMFKLGIAAAPLTDWRNYDTIYTERYMQTPAHNPEGYQLSSVLAAAHNLHGRLLLVHGARDDNVHVQNTLQLIHKLQQAGKDFDLMIYPDDGHGLYGNGGHWDRLRLDSIKGNL